MCVLSSRNCGENNDNELMRRGVMVNYVPPANAFFSHSSDRPSFLSSSNHLPTFYGTSLTDEFGTLTLFRPLLRCYFINSIVIITMTWIRSTAGVRVGEIYVFTFLVQPASYITGTLQLVPTTYQRALPPKR